MLRLLKIQNLAVIDEASLEIGKGFVCLTGESGAGKSVLIDALLLLGGGRASSDLVRTGCDKAIVEAEFDLDHVPEGFELLDDNQLFLRREVTKEGKSRAFVNGAMVSATVLGQYGELAFEIHGQHGQQRLLKPMFHQRVFEEQMGLRGDSENFDQALSALKKNLKHYWSLVDGEAERLKEIDFARMQLEDIEKVKPNEEDADLDQRLKVARNAEMIRADHEDMGEILRRELLPGMDRLEKIIGRLLEFRPDLEPYLSEVVSAGTTLGELQNETMYWDGDASDLDLAKLEDRESALNRLYLKYGRNLEEVMAEQERLKSRLKELQGESGSLDGAWAKLEAEYQKLLKQRERLTAKREKAAGVFAKEVAGYLADLALNQADFQVDMAWETWPTNLPEERNPRLPAPEIQFLFSSNPGEPARALAKVASGGELSRVLLALISSFKRNSSRLLVFDEIDAGLGGETAHAVGARLNQLGEDHQVLCVTHFAQVARFASQQIKIAKNVEEGRTFTRLAICEDEERVSELARLMGGDTQAEGLREHARALLAGE